MLPARSGQRSGPSLVTHRYGVPDDPGVVGQRGPCDDPRKTSATGLGPAHSVRTVSVRTVVKDLRRKLCDDADNLTCIANEPCGGYWMSVSEGEGE